MTCGIYKIQNRINKKIYIGQSVDILQRWRAHKMIGNNINHECNYYPLYKDMYEYGLDNFDFLILEECTKNELDNKEKFYIKQYNCMIPNGYNQTPGGQTGAHPMKLTYDEVVEIRSLLKETKETGLSLANRFNVSKDTITSINEGHSWYEDDINYPIRPMTFLICKICGIKISSGNKSGLCIKCYNNLRSKKSLEDRISREELKKIIRVQSFAQIGRLFNVSDAAVRKWCEKYKLPTRKCDIEKISDEEWEKL